MKSKNKKTLSSPVGAVSNRTGLESIVSRDSYLGTQTPILEKSTYTGQIKGLGDPTSTKDDASTHPTRLSGYDEMSTEPSQSSGHNYWNRIIELILSILSALFQDVLRASYQLTSSKGTFSTSATLS